MNGPAGLMSFLIAYQPEPTFWEKVVTFTTSGPWQALLVVYGCLMVINIFLRILGVAK